MTDAEKIRAHWNAQAALGAKSGTRDLILKQLEQRFLAPYLATAERVLDAGCGDGETLRAEAKRRDDAWSKLIGFDNAAQMIAAARDEPYGGDVRWFEHSLLDPIPPEWGQFDLVFTERAIINLPTRRAEQVQAIRNLKAAVAPGGRLVLIENSADALARLNTMRETLDLPAIMKPWHNLYLHERLMCDVVRDGYFAPHDRPWPVRFTDAYYFLSRVVNAAQAKAVGREPAYDAPVNALALTLPLETACGGVGQTVAWVS